MNTTTHPTLTDIATTSEAGEALLKALGLQLSDLVTKVEVIFEVHQPVIVRTESLVKSANSSGFVEKLAEYRLTPKAHPTYAAPAQQPQPQSIHTEINIEGNRS